MSRRRVFGCVPFPLADVLPPRSASAALMAPGNVARARVWALPYYVALGLASEAIGLPAPLALVVGLRHVLVLAFVGWLDTRLPVLGVAYPWLGRIEAWAGGRVSTAIVRASRAA